MGSLLAISSAASPTTTRFLAPPRGPGYQLASVALGAAPARQVVHDTSGRAQVDGAATYEWDDLDELVVVRQAGQPQEVLLYDGVGRLAGRLTQQSGGLGLKEAYVYDGSQMAAAFDSGGGLRWEATWGPGVDNLVAVNAGGKELLAVTDFRRDVAGLFDASANRLDYTAQYTPEGRVTTEDSAAGVSCAEVDATRCPSLGGQPFGLHSAWKSDVSGLVYFRNRWYSPELGEFLSHDALGYADSFSLYAFNGFDAVNRWDPFGLSGPGVTPPEPPPPPPAPGYDHASAQERAWAANEARPAPGSGVTSTPTAAPGASQPRPPRAPTPQSLPTSITRLLFKVGRVDEEGRPLPTTESRELHYMKQLALAGARGQAEVTQQYAGGKLFDVAGPFLSRAGGFFGRQLAKLRPGLKGEGELNLSPGQKRAILDWLRRDALAKGGFGPQGQPIILDENISARGLPEALRERGYNVRSVREVFGNNPQLADPVIRDYADAINARVLTRDLGRDQLTGGGFGQRAINVQQRAGVNPDTIGRIIDEALRR